MELKNIKQIQSLIKDGIKLYLIIPSISSTGKIINSKVFDVVNCSNYRYSFNVMTKPVGEFVLFRREHIEDKEIRDTDVISNSKVRIFASKIEAQKALDDEVKILCYESIKYIDRELASIQKSKEKLEAKEAKYISLRKEHYELSLKRFSKNS